MHLVLYGWLVHSVALLLEMVLHSTFARNATVSRKRVGEMAVLIVCSADV
jgi:hypothetical protein